MSERPAEAQCAEDTSLVPPGELVLVAGGFLALALAVTYPLVLFLPRGLPNDLGDPLLNTWTLAWVASRIPYGLWGVWDAPIFFPYRGTLAFSEHLIGIALFTAPIQWLSGNPILGYNLAFLGSYVLAGIGMYGLARHFTGRRDAAWLAGLAFAFHPYRVAQFPHLQVLMWGWMPVALWALHHYCATGSRRALAGFVGAFVLQALSNGYFFYFLSFAVLVVAAFELTRSRRRWRTAIDLVAAGAAALLALAPVMAAYAFVRREYGLRRTFGELVGFSADVASYGAVTSGLWWWGRRLPIGRGELELFPGLTVLLLALAAFWPSRHAPSRRPGVALYTTMAAGAFVLSLGPRPHAWGKPLAESGPYEWLWRYLPGFDGLRVPARWAAIVYLALAVLAALGARRLLAALPRPAGVAATVVLGAMLLVEGYGPLRVVSFRPAPEPAARAAYLWLRDAPPGGVLELPLGAWDWGRTLVRELRYQYGTLVHGKPVVNGFSGYESPLRGFLLDSPVLSPPELPAAVEALRTVGVRYLVLHLDEFEAREWGLAVFQTLRTLERSPEQALGSSRREAGGVGSVVEHVVFGSVAVFRLADLTEKEPRGPSLCGRRLDSRRFTVTASHAVSRLAFAFDGDLDTRWLSEHAQDGDEWIALSFDPPQVVAGVRFELGPYSWGDYPRELIIEGQEAGRTNRAALTTLFRGPVLTQMLVGLLREPDRAPIELAWPARSLAMLRLRQTGRADPWYWSINELVVCAPSAPPGRAW